MTDQYKLVTRDDVRAYAAEDESATPERVAIRSEVSWNEIILLRQRAGIPVSGSPQEVDFFALVDYLCRIERALAEQGVDFARLAEESDWEGWTDPKAT